MRQKEFFNNKKCNNCGKIVPEDTGICDKCGAIDFSILKNEPEVKKEVENETINVEKEVDEFPKDIQEDDEIIEDEKEEMFEKEEKKTIKEKFKNKRK